MAAINVRLNSVDTWRVAWQSIEALTIIGAKFGDDPVNTGASNDTLRLSGSQASGSTALVSTGAGQDRISLTGEFSGRFTRVLAGADDDLVDLSGVTALFGTGTLSSDLRGGSGDDTLIGSNLRDQLIGDAGADRLVGRGGDDNLNGGAGADIMEGGGGNDRYAMDDAGDQMVELTGGGNDTVYVDFSYTLGETAQIENLGTLTPSSTAALVLIGNSAGNSIVGNAGANLLDGREGRDNMRGGAGDDVYYVDSAADAASEIAGGGFDRVYSTAAVFQLTSTSDVELLSTASRVSTATQTLAGSDIANRLFGNAGTNYLDGGAGADLLYGLGGDDFYFVDNAGDYVIEVAGGGSDIVYATQSYSLRAGDDVETLIARTRGITLIGNEIANRLEGAGGAETIDGGRGRDLLYGISGADTFRFTSLGEANADTIFDFRSGDKIALATTAFAGVVAGPLAADAFVIGTAAQDANDRVLYDRASGMLFFDRDGTGATAPVVFAQLDGSPVISAADFVII